MNVINILLVGLIGGAIGYGLADIGKWTVRRWVGPWWRQRREYRQARREMERQLQFRRTQAEIDAFLRERRDSGRGY